MQREFQRADKIRCDACPVMCFIRPGQTGACDRYANHDGELVRTDPHVLLDRTLAQGGAVVPFGARLDWDGELVRGRIHSSPRSAPARPIPITSPRPSSCPPRSTASTW